VPTRPAHLFTLTLRAPLTCDEVPVLCREATLILASTPTRVIRCDVSAVSDPDTAALEAIARLALTSRRFGASIELHGACPRLHDIVELAGLADVISVRARSGIEMGRQAEEREERVGVEEEVEADDRSV
jgi:ABC-type transporter Mla MlaB component